MSDNLNEEIKELYQAILSLKDESECEKFFNDLCTYKELESMAQRLFSAKLLMSGNTYEQVIEKAKISSATLSRVSKCVKYGVGYRQVLENK